MTLLLGALVAVLYEALLVVMLGAAIGWSAGILWSSHPWLQSELPRDKQNDPSYDPECLGWWSEPPQVFASHDEGAAYYVMPDDAVLITEEEVRDRYLTVWHFMDGARL